MIIGHKKKLDFLYSALENQTIAHALCFTGPESVGKRAVAQEIFARALKTDVNRLLSHPDFLFIEREIDEKKDRLNRDINIAQAKKVNGFLRNRSWLGQMKAVLIDEADSLNIEAANALLKTLEDSTEGNIIILLTINDRSLPATVRSRCQIVEFSLVQSEDIRQGLIALGFDEKIGAEAAELSWGRPGRAINFLKDNSLLNEYREEVERLKQISGKPFYYKLKATDDLFGDKEDAIRGRDRLKKIIDLWTMLWRDTMRGTKVFERAVGSREALEVINDLQEARQMLGQNIHPRLIIERILLKI